ncbi:MAG: PAS domain S-box protein [Methanoregulaceae archaeon]
MSFSHVPEIFRISGRNRFALFALVTLISFAVAMIAYVQGISGVFSNVLFFPVILACYWYPRRGVFISLGLAALYGGITVLVAPAGSLNVPTLLFQMAFFVLVGGVISLLSSKLSLSEQQMHTIIEFLPDATFAIDREGKVLAWNRAIEEMTGVRKEEMLSRGNYEYGIPFYGERRPLLINLILHDDPAIREYYPVILQDGDRLSSELFIPHFRGDKGVHFWFFAKALIDADGNVTGAIESIRNVTDKVMTETALATTGNRLNTIAGIIRHGLSKKLAVLYGQLSLGVMKFDNPAVISFIGDLKESAESIQRLVEISRAFRDIGTEPPVWIPVQKAVCEAANGMDPDNAVFRSWTERLEVFADPHLTTAFFHIFENARKISPGADRMVVTYQVLSEGCVIRVEDNGMGFPGSVKDALFTQEKENCGSGLYLAHEILMITGMTIRETGTPGKGIRFEITVPSEGYRVV